NRGTFKKRARQPLARLGPRLGRPPGQRPHRAPPRETDLPFSSRNGADGHPAGLDQGGSAMQRQGSGFSVSGNFVVGLLSAMVVSAACGGSASDQGDRSGNPHSPSAETGKVKGVAVDTQSRPLSGAKIDVCSSVFYESCVSGSTGSDGSYSLSLTPTNVWRAH